jgi:hypothetical protein
MSISMPIRLFMVRAQYIHVVSMSTYGTYARIEEILQLHSTYPLDRSVKGNALLRP